MHVAWWVPFAFLAPALAGLVAFRVVPIGIALAGGFFGTSLMGETLFRGLANYEGLLADPSFWAGVRVTLLFNLLINPLQVALAFLLALLTFRPTRFVVTFRTIYFLPITTSIAVTAVLWNILLDPNVGPVNALLRAIGVPTQPFFRGEGQALPALLYGDDNNFTKFGRIAHTAAGDEKFEFIYENNALARNDAVDSTANIAADFPDDFWVRLTSDGTNVVGHYSTNGIDVDGGRAPGADPGQRQDRPVRVLQRRPPATRSRPSTPSPSPVRAPAVAAARRPARATTTSSTTRRSTRRVGTRSSATPRPSTTWPAAS